MPYPIYYDGELTVTPALSECDAVIFTAITEHNNQAAVETYLSAWVKSLENSDPPYFGGLLEISENRSEILPEEGESAGGITAWLPILLEHFFEPRGYAMSGQISWSARDDSEDRGVIYVSGSRAEVVSDVIQNFGPSWKAEVFLSPKAIELVQQLMDSSSDEGCTPDLVVVGAVELKALQDAIQSPSKSAF